MRIVEAVLDASAIMAVFRAERGRDLVRDLDQPWVSTVNLAEAANVMVRHGFDPNALDEIPFNISVFDREDARETGRLLRLTRPQGLSLADCACLALGRRLELPVFTTDRIWAALDLGVEVVLIR